MRGIYRYCLAWTFLVKLRQVMDNINLSPNSVSIGACISACANAASWCGASALLQDHFERKLELNVILLASTASAHQRDLSSQWRKALMILEMGEDRSIQLNTFLLGSTLQAHPKSKWVTALGCFAELVRRALRLTDVAAAILVGTVVWEKALEVFLKSAAHGLQLNKAGMTAGLSTVADAQHWQRTLVTLRAVPTMGTLTALTTTVVALARARRRAEATKVLQEMRFGAVEVDRVAQGVALSVLSWDLALQQMSEMSQDFRQDPILQTAGIAAFEASGQWLLALWVLHENPRSTAAVNAAVAVAQRRFLWALALQLLSQGLERQVETDLLSWTSTIGACSRAVTRVFETAKLWRWPLKLLDSLKLQRLQPALLTITEAASIPEPCTSPRLLRFLQEVAAASTCFRPSMISS
ncbi:unnamed protein product [Durusdinium trenchii]|uniref:Pentatricopeptide repeat-containing protein, chloroplastic n=3 Tax=Durusdinium trenchii TaxID=1381693 RepID=A0ABP0MFN1_9DINO